MCCTTYSLRVWGKEIYRGCQYKFCVHCPKNRVKTCIHARIQRKILGTSLRSKWRSKHDTFTVLSNVLLVLDELGNYLTLMFNTVARCMLLSHKHYLDGI